MNFKKELKQWQYDIIGLITGVFILIMVVYYYDVIVFRKNFGSTNDQVLGFFLNLMDKQGGKPYVYGFMTLLILFFGVSAVLGYRKEKMNKSQQPTENKFIEKPKHEITVQKNTISIKEDVPEKPFDHYDHCPACGFKLKKSDKECPDCGLNLS